MFKLYFDTAFACFLGGILHVDLGLSLLSILTPLSLRRPYSQVPLTSEQSDTIVTLDSILPRLILD